MKCIGNPHESNRQNEINRIIVKFFQTGIYPVSFEYILEIFTFMEAAYESISRGEAFVSLNELKQKTLNQLERIQ